MKKKVYYLTGLLLMFFIMFMPRMNAAAAANKAVKMAPGTLWYGDEVYGGPRYSAATDKAKLVSVKSSRPKVIRASKYKGDSSLWSATLMPLKLGKSKITVTYKYKGKKYTTSAVYTVKKYPSPFKMIKVNGSKINLKSHKFSYDVENYKKDSVKIRFSLKAGWRLSDGYTFGDNYELIEVKNGATVKVPKNGEWTCIFFNVTNKKGETMQYSLRFKRG